MSGKVTDGGAHRSGGSSTRWWNPIRTVVLIIGGLHRWTVVVGKGSYNTGVERGDVRGSRNRRGGGVKLTYARGVLVEIWRGVDRLWRPGGQAVVEKYQGGGRGHRRLLFDENSCGGEEHDDWTGSNFLR
jgi:hypothetical protein